MIPWKKFCLILNAFNFIAIQGFAIPKDKQNKVAKFTFEGKPAELGNGSVVIAAITSCTNTSNPSVMLGAGLVAKKASERGLTVSSLTKLKYFIRRMSGHY